MLPTTYPNTLAVSGSNLAIGWPARSFDVLNPTAEHGAVCFWSLGDGNSTAGYIINPNGNTIGAAFGYSVALQGNNLAVGAPAIGTGSGATGAGQVFVYTYSLGAWLLQQTLTKSSGAVGDYFGATVAFDSNGNLLVGATQPSTGNGVAVVFLGSPGSYTQSQVLVAGDAAAGAQFGAALSINGTTAAIGAPGAASGAGEAYVFTSSGGTYTQAHALSQPHSGDTGFGFAVLLGSTYLFVGSPGDGVTLVGAVEIYPVSTFTGPTRISSGSAGDLFGYALGGLATYLFVGAPNNSSAVGCVWYYSLVASVWTEQQQVTPNSATGPASMGETVGWDGSDLYAGSEIAVTV